MPRGPWQLIIRARTESELDRAIIIVSGRIAATVGSPRLSRELEPVVAHAVADSVASIGQRSAATGVSADKVVSALAVLADYEDICPTPYIFPFQGPHVPGPHHTEGPDPMPWRESFDAAALAATQQLAALTTQGQGVAEAAGSLLKQIAG
jgi:hypothetical protein